MAICLQHTNDTIPSIANYTLAVQSVPQVDTLGTAIYVNNEITYDKIQINTSEYQLSGIKLCLKDNKFNLFNIYNQPSCHYDLQNLPNVLPNMQEDFVLVGDFNAHNSLWNSACTDCNTDGIKVEKFVVNHNLCILNDGDVNTYYSKSHGTFSSIDLSICTANIVDRFEWNVLDDLYSSDHFPILITTLGNNPTPPIKRFNMNKADWDSYKHYTSQCPDFNPLIDHDETADFIKKFITTAAEKTIPLCATHPMKHSVPWWSDSLSDLIKEKHHVGRRLETLNKRFSKLSAKPQMTDETLNKIIDISIEISVLKPYFNKISAKFRKEAIRGRIISWQKYVSTISENTSIKKVWQKFRSINGTNKRPPRHALIQNGLSIHDPYEISNILGRNIENISSTTNLDNHFKTIKMREEAIPLNFETLEDIYYNKRFTEEELDFALSNCSSSAPGQDNITFEMIINLAPSAKTYILQFYNHLWTNHLFPKSWKHAIVIPIVKPGKDPSKPNNYRPISLTSCLCKILEKMVNYRLNWCLQKNKILSPSQFGSQPERSTLDSLTHLEDHIRRGFERKQITVALFFDIQKAYDTAWRHSILRTLHLNGFRGHLPMFIKNFIYERTFQTRVDNVYSDTFKLENGVPQGSVLSGTLFILSINDIVTQLPHGVKNNLYVDDFTIYYSSNNLRHLQRILNTAIQKIHNWCTSVGFKLATEKTQAIMFYKNVKWKKNQEIDLKIGNTQIEFKETVKFLGLVFDSHLNWKAHISYIKTKCNSALNLIKKLSHTSWGAKRSTIMMIYKALILSRIDYGCQIYGSASQASLKFLDPIHTQGIRLSTGAFRSSPNSSVLCESGEPPLSFHREYVTIRSALKILTTNSPTKALFDLKDIFIDNHEPPFPIRANRLLGALNMRMTLPQPSNIPPPWIMKKVNVCFHLAKLSKKNDLSPNYHKQYALEHIHRKGPHYAIYTDGSKSVSGVGCAAVSVNKSRKFSLPKEATVFTAELSAILVALDIIKTSKGKHHHKFIIYSDSKSALEAINSYMHKNHLVQQIKNIFSKFYAKGLDIEICWIPAHVGISGNEEADVAAKSAVISPPYRIKLPIKDYMNIIKHTIMMKWQDQWSNESNNNKLKQIKSNVTLWKSSLQVDKKAEVVLTRLRIGHTRLTHGYLMSTPHGDIPRCNSCNTLLTVKHILCECADFNRQRVTYLKCNSLKEILSESDQFSMFRILTFLRKCNLLNKI